jgi:hypothetical protein
MVLEQLALFLFIEGLKAKNKGFGAEAVAYKPGSRLVPYIGSACDYDCVRAGRAGFHDDFVGLVLADTRQFVERVDNQYRLRRSGVVDE